ncbi:MAG: type III pantothenate kinase [Acidithiobacillus sp.]|nr:type III pantothenate kinase [Acidithiobacillus sp.]
MILIAVGNTHTLVARRAEGPHWEKERFASTLPPAQVRAQLPQHWHEYWQEEPAYIAGVVPQQVAAWKQELAMLQLPSWDPERFHQLLPNQYSPPQSLGFDRRCCLLGAQRMISGGSALVIDAGTAITIDCLHQDHFLGGQILPGLRSQLRALSQDTALLPDLEGSFPSHGWLGNGTEEAIFAGVWHGILGALGSAISHFQKHYPGGRILLTGGDAPTLASAIPAAEVQPDLLLDGFFQLVRAGSSSEKD